MSDFLTPIAKSYIQVIDFERNKLKLSPSDITFTTNEKTGEIDFSIPEKVIAQDTGRRAFARRVPTSILIVWMKKYGLNIENNNVFAIQEAIFKRGTKAKKFLEKSKNVGAEIANTTLSMNFSDLLNDKIKRI